MSITRDYRKSYVIKRLKTVKETFCRLRQDAKLRAKHGSARKDQFKETLAVPHDDGYGGIRSDSATGSTVTDPSCLESTLSSDMGGLRTDSPASLVSDYAESHAETPKLIPKKGNTFPISKSDSKVQDLEELANNQRGARDMGSKLKEVGQREAQTLSQRQVFSGNFKQANEVGEQKLRQGILPDLTQLGLLHSQVQQANSTSAEDSKQFVKIWELDLLPKLEDILDSNVEGEYSINVRRGEKPGYRIIEIMTAEDVAIGVRSLLENSKKENLKGDIGSRTSMRIRLGTIEFLTDEALSRRSTQSEDSWDDPINTRRYTNPLMGDSVGPNQAEGGSATIGPLLQITRKFYRILNWHIFDDKGANRLWNGSTPPTLDAYHPSLAERGEQSFSIGQTAAYSGPMHNTSRASRSIQKACSLALGTDVKETQTVTDWVLVEANTGHQVNKIRKATATAQSRCNSFSESIVSIADPIFGSSRLVYSTGRTSGYSFGQICEVLGESRLWNGTKTRNWSIESTDTQVPDEAWNRGGMGVPGDSGAPVIDKDTNCLLGQIWGRNKYKTSPHDRPLTYFTAMSDIYDDIRERMPDLGTPRLPTNTPVASDSSRSTSPVPNTPITIRDSRRQTLASISEDGDEQLTAQVGSFSQRRSVARAPPRTSTMLSGYGSFSGMEPVRRLTTIIHAATL
ncbi:hypothetical protein F4776DRAFT_667966 [Hypoxylon sp. NC0597]|nr:hypothetical protein F4776DRAFT_667966 [Hypoxylon sp. NC0597]